ncbi:MAG: nucleotide exchange factor GrpE [Candidatus Pacebacteria bacterium]|nr:nucleotide exchange factor GrpE [Candidatus Paceibacterota bacterium]
MPITKKEKLKASLKKTNKGIEEHKKKAEENLIGWQRAKADFLNYKRDQEKYIFEFRKYANEDIIVKILPTIDGFELALKHMPKELEKSDWVTGIVCIKNQLENILKEAGLEEIKAVGEKFDPNLFESIGEEESNEQEDTVVSQTQKGYKLLGKVIRPARVKIAKKKI